MVTVLKKIFVMLALMFSVLCYASDRDIESETIKSESIRDDFDNFFQIVEKMITTRLESLWFFRNEDIETCDMFLKSLKKRINRQTRRAEAFIDNDSVAQLPFNLR